MIRIESDLQIAHLLRLLRAGRHQEGEVGPRRDVAAAHLHVLLHQVRAGAEAADADVPAPLATGSDGARVRLFDFRMVELACDPQVGHQVVDAHHPMSTPSTAMISSIAASEAADSNCTITIVASFSAGSASAAGKLR